MTAAEPDNDDAAAAADLARAVDIVDVDPIEARRIADDVLRRVPASAAAAALVIAAGGTATARHWSLLSKAVVAGELSPWLHVAAVEAAIATGALVDRRWLEGAIARHAQLPIAPHGREGRRLSSAIGHSLQRLKEPSGRWLDGGERGWPAYKHVLPSWKHESLAPSSSLAATLAAPLPAEGDEDAGRVDSQRSRRRYIVFAVALVAAALSQCVEKVSTIADERELAGSEQR